jgi:hypothetical protein
VNSHPAFWKLAMPVRQKQFVSEKVYQVQGPSGKNSKLVYLGKFKVNGDQILMFKHRRKPK